MRNSSKGNHKDKGENFLSFSNLLLADIPKHLAIKKNHKREANFLDISKGEKNICVIKIILGWFQKNLLSIVNLEDVHCYPRQDGQYVVDTHEDSPADADEEV